MGKLANATCAGCRQRIKRHDAKRVFVRVGTPLWRSWRRYANGIDPRPHAVYHAGCYEKGETNQ